MKLDSANATGVLLEVTSLMKIAVGAYKEISDEEGSLRPHEHKALISICFAAFFLEAFVNEIHAIARISKNEKLLLLSEFLDLAEEQHASLTRKLKIIRRVLVGETLHTGQEPFQAMGLLFQVRDAIVHKRGQTFEVIHEPLVPRTTNVTSHELEMKLRGYKILAPKKPKHLVGFIDRLSTKKAAGWACQTAIQTVEVLAAWFPEEEFWDISHIHLYSQSFQHLNVRIGSGNLKTAKNKKGSGSGEQT